MKRIRVWSRTIGTFFVVMSLLVAGCGQSSQSETSDTPQEKEKITLRVAGQFPEDHPNTQSLKELKQRVEEQSNGQIELNIYPANMLGDYTQVYEEIMKGTIEMGLINIPSQYDPKFEILYLHSLAENWETAKKVYAIDSPLAEIIAEMNENQGVKFLGFHAEGFDGISTTKEVKNPASPSDKKDVLLRIPPIEIFKISSSDLGFNNVTIPFSELYTALQTGVADGAVGLAPNTVWSGFRDVVKYYYLYNNFFETSAFLMNLDLWNSLSEEHQQLLSEITADLSIKSFDVTQQAEQDYLNKMRENGIQVIEFTDEELKAIAEYTRNTIWPKLKDQFGEDLMNKLIP